MVFPQEMNSGFDAAMKIKGHTRHKAVDTEGSPIDLQVHRTDVRDRDGASDVIVELLCKVPQVFRLFANGGYARPKLRDGLADLEVSDLIEIVEEPKQIREFTVLYRRWVMERTFAWMGRCRRLAKDFGHTETSSLAWAKLSRANS